MSEEFTELAGMKNKDKAIVNTEKGQRHEGTKQGKRQEAIVKRTQLPTPNFQPQTSVQHSL